MTPGEGRRASWRCPGCTALAVNASTTREALGEEQFNEIWQSLRSGAESGIPCPECGHSMNATRVDDVHLEGCAICTLLWFESGEWETALKNTPGSENLLEPLTEEEMQEAVRRWRDRRATEEARADGGVIDEALERLLAPPSPRAQLLGIWLNG